MADIDNDHDDDCGCNKCCPGPMGPLGPVGPIGPTGSQGRDGRDGRDGQKGEKGDKGDKGDRGDKGDTGDKGDRGDKGDKGDPGQPGLNGLPGQNGLDGAQGPIGPKGDQGPQGVKGDCVECECECEDVEFCEVYSAAAQTLFASPSLNAEGGQVLFENLVFSTPNIDVSQAAISGDITINKAGWYRISEQMNGRLNPLALPLIAWGLGVFLNDVLVPWGVMVNMTLSPDQQDNFVSHALTLHLNAGNKIGIYNITNVPLILSTVNNGINAAVNSAYLLINSLSFD